MGDLPSPSSFGTEPLRIVIREGDETAGSGYDYVSSSSPPQLSKNAMDPQQAYVLGLSETGSDNEILCVNLVKDDVTKLTKYRKLLMFSVMKAEEIDDSHLEQKLEEEKKKLQDEINDLEVSTGSTTITDANAHDEAQEEMHVCAECHETASSELYRCRKCKWPLIIIDPDEAMFCGCQFCKRSN